MRSMENLLIILLCIAVCKIELFSGNDLREDGAFETFKTLTCYNHCAG